MADPLSNYDQRLGLANLLADDSFLTIDLLPQKASRGDIRYREYTLVLDLDETLVHFDH